MNRLLNTALAGTAAAALCAGPALADEGMWTFDNFPAAKVKAAYGVDITPAWLDHIQKSAVRLAGGCSASVVSSQGLVLTNNHCVSDCAQNFGAPGQDVLKQGWIAKGREGEKTCAGQQAEILLTIADVTPRVTAAGQGLAGAALVQARQGVTSAIEKEVCGSDTKLRCQVVRLYQGGQYKLYKYRKYSDVRLVFSPGAQTAFFGGDPDNFNFPRYDLDSAFLRLYEDGKPVATPDHLTWNAAPPKAGEPVFVAGNPGGTERQLTVSQLEVQRDFSIPLALVQQAELRGRLIQFCEQSPENARIIGEELFGLENGYKVTYGRLFALNDKAFMDTKRAAEADLRAKAGSAIGDPWATVAAAQEARKELYDSYRFLEGGASDLFGYARVIVRAAAEREKPSAQRLPGYSDSQLPLVQKQLLDAKPIEKSLERLLLEHFLLKAREHLTADDPTTKLLLGRDSQEELSARLVNGTKLADPAVRKALFDGGMKAVSASTDPMIRYVLRLDPAARAIRKEWENRVTGPAVLPTEAIARARFAAYGDSQYPDATFTLRLSYGKIEGWTEKGKAVPPFTYMSGLWERATGKAPFDLDPRWTAAKAKLNPKTVFNISTTNDIIGGNSGSPLINAKGEVIGAIFDGNIHSLGGDYGYDPVLNRSVAVSTEAVTEALEKVYKVDSLVRELKSSSGG
ncbi:S46 family peptidase [soil metagenome]